MKIQVDEIDVQPIEAEPEVPKIPRWRDTVIATPRGEMFGLYGSHPAEVKRVFDGIREPAVTRGDIHELVSLVRRARRSVALDRARRKRDTENEYIKLTPRVTIKQGQRCHSVGRYMVIDGD